MFKKSIYPKEKVGGSTNKNCYISIFFVLKIYYSKCIYFKLTIKLFDNI